MIDFKTIFTNRKVLRTSVVIFQKGSERKLALMNHIYYENEIVCTLPADYDPLKLKDLNYIKQPIFKYKIGDGIHHWVDLPYQDGTIPIGIVCHKASVPRYSSLEEALKDNNDDNVYQQNEANNMYYPKPFPTISKGKSIEKPQSQYNDNIDFWRKYGIK